jgi:hypothetical protein
LRVIKGAKADRVSPSIITKPHDMLRKVGGLHGIANKIGNRKDGRVGTIF